MASGWYGGCLRLKDMQKKFQKGKVHENIDSCLAVGSSHLVMQRLPKFGIREYNLGHLAALSDHDIKLTGNQIYPGLLL